MKVEFVTIHKWQNHESHSDVTFGYLEEGRAGKRFAYSRVAPAQARTPHNEQRQIQKFIQAKRESDHVRGYEDVTERVRVHTNRKG